MSRSISTGIDIGTYHVKVVIVEQEKGRKSPRVLGTGFSESRGMRFGYITNRSDVSRSVRQAVQQAEKQAGVSVRRAFVSLGGVGLESFWATGSTIISRGDNTVTELDIDRALDEAEHSLPEEDMLNRKVLHAIPLAFILDKKRVMGRPIGMRGVKLSVETHFVTCLEQHLEDTVEAVEAAGIAVEDVVAAPLAASFATLTKAQKIAGCVLANIGSQTVSIIVYEDNLPISIAVFPLGSNDITHDIALGLQIPLEEAERVKLGALTARSIPKKRLDEIVNARLTDIFEVIEGHLKKIGKNGLLPAGVILTGGGSGLTAIESFARETLKLPSKIAELHVRNTHLRDASWAVSFGLAVLGSAGGSESTGISIVKHTKKGFISWIKQFLP